MTGPDDTQPPAGPTPPPDPAASPDRAAAPGPLAAPNDVTPPDRPATPAQAAPGHEAAPVAAPDQAAAPDEAAGPGHEGEPRSGLRNPAAAVRGVGAGALVIEALVLLLAIVPLTKLDTRATGWAIGAVVALCVVCVALAGLLRYRWAWYAGVAVQLLVCLCGFFHLMLLVFGIIFGAVWAYVLSVRHSVLGEL